MRERRVMAFFLALIMFFCFGRVDGLPSALTLEKASLLAQSEAEALKQEIRLLNLVNGLELSLEQMQLIREKACVTQRLRQELRSFYALMKPELTRVLEEIKKIRLQNKDVPPELARRFHSLDMELKRRRTRVGEAIEALAREVEKVLEQHQLYALESYVPCVIPPKGESRIGQAEDLNGLSRRLSRLREVPDWVYKRRKDQIVNRTLEMMKLRAGPFFDEERADEITEKLGDFYDRLRGLKEVDFEIQKEDLAREFAALLKPKSRSQSLTRKIEAFLLAPEIIPILEARIQKAQSND